MSRLALKGSFYRLLRAYGNGRVEAALKTLGVLKAYVHPWRERRAMRRARRLVELYNGRYYPPAPRRIPPAKGAP